MHVDGASQVTACHINKVLTNLRGPSRPVPHARRVPVKVLTIYRDEQEVTAARPGENLRLRLQGIEEDDISSGFVVSSRFNPVPAVTFFEAQVRTHSSSGGGGAWIDGNLAGRAAPLPEHMQRANDAVMAHPLVCTGGHPGAA